MRRSAPSDRPPISNAAHRLATFILAALSGNGFSTINKIRGNGIVEGIWPASAKKSFPCSRNTSFSPPRNYGDAGRCTEIGYRLVAAQIIDNLGISHHGADISKR